MLRSPWPPSGVAGAALRLLALLAAASLLVLLIALPIALLTHGSVNRAVSLGFYVVGAFLVVIGFAGGSRGPFRSAQEDPTRITVGRTLRRATLDELNEAISVAAIVVAIGLALLVIGVAIDNRYTLL